MKEIKNQELQEINGGSAIVLAGILILSAGMLKGCSDGRK